MYNHYIDVIVRIKNLITAYTMRGEHKIVKGLEMALEEMFKYNEIRNIFERDF